VSTLVNAQLEGAVVRAHGRGALLPIQLAKSTRRWLAPDGSCVIAYADALGVRVALGTPIGPPECWPRAMVAFGAHARSGHRMPSFYQLDAPGLRAARGAGLSGLKVGDEAVLELEGFSLDGAKRANLRHTVSRARRGGLTGVWLPTGTDAALRDELADLDRAWRRGRRLVLRFTVGSLDPAEEGVATAVTLDRTGRAAALTTYRRTGVDGGWVLELIRRRPDAVPGAVELAIVTAALALSGEGVPTLSLGLAPTRGLAASGASGPERWLHHPARLVRRWYRTDGLAFFKGKFDPRWEPRYLAAPGRPGQLRAIAALIALHLFGPQRRSSFHRVPRQVELTKSMD